MTYGVAVTLADLSRIDPTIAATPDGFVMLLRQVRMVSSMSYWEIEQRAADLGIMLEPASLVESLSGPDLPAEEMVVGFLLACGFTDDQLDRWMWVYRGLAQPIQPAPPAQPAAPHRNRRRLLIVVATTVAVITVVAVALREGRRSPTGIPAPVPASDGPVEGAGGVSPVPSIAPVQPSGAPPSPSPTVSRTPARSSTSPATGGAAPETAATLATHQGIDLDTGRLSDGPALISNVFDAVAISGGIRAGDTEKRLSKGCTEQPDRTVTGLAAGSTLCVFSTGGKWYRLTITGTGSTGYAFTYLVFS